MSPAPFQFLDPSIRIAAAASVLYGVALNHNNNVSMPFGSAVPMAFPSPGGCSGAGCSPSAGHGAPHPGAVPYPVEDPLPAVVGVTYELCAGIVDKPHLSLEEIACEEILEECGYRVPVTNLKKITSYRSGVGVTGSRQTLFYAEVTDQMKTSGGGGQPEEGELIEVVEIPLEDSMKFAYDETLPKTMGVIFSFTWFQNNIAPKLPKSNIKAP